MLHQLRQSQLTPALLVMLALLWCSLFGCLQHRLSLPNLLSSTSHSMQTMADHHDMHSTSHGKAQQSCHQQSECSLEHGKTVPGDFSVSPYASIVLIALLPLALFQFWHLSLTQEKEAKATSPPPSGSYPPTYLKLLVLRN